MMEHEWETMTWWFVQAVGLICTKLIAASGCQEVLIPNP